MLAEGDDPPWHILHLALSNGSISEVKEGLVTAVQFAVSGYKMASLS